MDNNFNGSNGESFGQPDMTQQTGYVQPDMSQQTTYVQPDMSQQTAYVQPDMASQTGYVQPDMSQQTAYVQPDMNQQYNYAQPDMNQQYAYAQPGMPVTPVQPVNDGKKAKKQKAPKGPKKPLGKGAIAGIICGGVALVAAIVCGIIFIPKLFKSPKDTVIDAFEDTFSASAQTDSYMEEVFGTSDMVKKMEENGASYEYQFSMNLGDEGAVDFATNAAYDIKNKELGCDLVASFDGTNIFTIQFHADEEKTYLAIPDVIDGYFSIPNKGALQAIANSPIAEAADIKDELNSMGISGGDLNYFPAEEGEEVEINSDMVKIVDGIWDKLVFEKQGKAKIDVNGETMSAKEYYVTLSEEDIEEAFVGIFDATIQMYKDMYQDAEELAQMEQSMEQVKTLIPSIVSGDFVLKVYIVKDKVVKIACDDDVNIMGMKLSYDCYVDITDDLSGKFELAVAGETVGVSFNLDDYKTAPTGEFKLYTPDGDIKVTIDTKAVDDDSTWSKDMTLAVIVDGETVADGNVQISISKKDYSFDMQLGINVDGEEIGTVTAKGQYVDIVKGESFGFNLDEIKVSIDGEEMTMSAKAKMSANPVVPEFDKSGKEYDITTITEDAFNQMIEDNKQKIEDWMQRLQDAGLMDDQATAVEEEPYEPEEEDNGDAEVSAEAASTLVMEEYSVEILGSLPGFTKDYDCEYFIDYVNQDNGTMIEYMLEPIAEDYGVQDIINDFTSVVVEEEKIEGIDYQEITISDGTVVKYCYYVTDLWGDGTHCYRYRFVREIDAEHALVADISFDDGIYSAEELAEAVASQYFSVK